MFLRFSQFGLEATPGFRCLCNYPLASIQNLPASLPHTRGAAGRSGYRGLPCFFSFLGLKTNLSPRPAAPTRARFLSLCSGALSVSADATKITLAPSSADINLGDNLTLQCHASHDPTMDLTFIWMLDDFPIDFDKPGGHYRRASVVRPQAREPRAPPSFWVDRGPKSSSAITTPKAVPCPSGPQTHRWVRNHPPLDGQVPWLLPKAYAFRRRLGTHLEFQVPSEDSLLCCSVILPPTHMMSLT